MRKPDTKEDVALKGLELVIQGTTIEDAAKTLGVQPHFLARHLGKYRELIPEIQGIKLFRAAQQTILDAINSKVLKAVISKLENEEEVERTSLKDLLQASKIVFEMSQELCGKRAVVDYRFRFTGDEAKGIVDVTER